MFVAFLVCIACENKDVTVSYFSPIDDYINEYKIDYSIDSILIYRKAKNDKCFIIDWSLYRKNGEYRTELKADNNQIIDVLFMSCKNVGCDTITARRIGVRDMEFKIGKEAKDCFSTSVFYLFEQDGSGEPRKNMIFKIIYDSDYDIKEIWGPSIPIRYIMK